jgi:hypothetical protein
MQEQLLSGVGGWIILKIDQACVQHVHGGTMGHPHITSSLPFAYHLKYLMIYIFDYLEKKKKKKDRFDDAMFISTNAIHASAFR